jgi:hypothetical protein
VGCLAAGAGRADDGGPAVDAGELVRQLGADRFEDREQASRALVERGLEAQAALVEGSRSGDAEIRFRSRRAWAVIVKVDLYTRLAAFAADAEDQKEHQIPGWERFRDGFGRDRAARELYVEMQRSEFELLALAESNPARAAEQFRERTAELQFLASNPLQQPLEIGRTSALLFVGSDPRIKLTQEALLPVYGFVNQPAFQRELLGGERSALSRKLLGAWISRHTDSATAYQNLHLAMRFNLKEGLAPALNLARRGGEAPQQLYALLAIGKLGGREHLAAVLPALENKTVGATGQWNHQMVKTEVRDVALAVAVHLTGQTPGDYGFQRAQAHPALLYNVHSLGFQENERREAALKKWSTWAAEHPAELASPAPSSGSEPGESRAPADRTAGRR